MTVQICIGSACHLKGSYTVIETFKTLLAQARLEDQVTLKSSFCMGACAGNVSVKIDDSPPQSVAPEDAQTFFTTCILQALQPQQEDTTTL